jgi:hypothetical protein
MKWPAERQLRAAQLSRVGLTAKDIAFGLHLAEEHDTPEVIAAKVRRAYAETINGMAYWSLFARIRAGGRKRIQRARAD